MGMGIGPAAKTIAIIQSSYIPWKGYFDIIRSVDEFVFLDVCQYTKRDWRNRNRIPTRSGVRWLTVPVRTRGRYYQKIQEVEIAEPWAERHWRSIETNYHTSPHFDEIAPRLHSLYRACADQARLSGVNRILTCGICELLGIRTRFNTAMEHPGATPSGRLIEICAALGARRYLTGPAAVQYLDHARFAEAGIEIAYAHYSGYPAYPQLFGAFDHHVSIIDLLFNAGLRALDYMRLQLNG